MPYRSIAVLAALAVPLVAAAPAGAATLTGDADGLTFIADSGVHNDTSVFGEPPDVVVISTADDPIDYPLPPNCEDADAQQNTAPASAVMCTAAAVTLELGDGADNASTSGAPAGITWLGGADGDSLRAGDGAQTLRGGAGDDALTARPDGSPDTLDGGDGVDVIEYIDETAYFVDLLGGSAGTTTAEDALAGIEDVANAAALGAPSTITGSNAFNVIETGSGPDTIDPKAGSDLVESGNAADVLELRDGYPDRVSCGPGTDSVQADTLDAVAADCENVTVTDVGDATDDVPEDEPPTVAITSPSPGAVLSTAGPNTIAAHATDDLGVARVVFSAGARVICSDDSAPYACEYRPTADDVGRATLVVTAVDARGQTATALQVVTVPRFAPVSLTSSTKPRRDRTAPFRFRTRGTLVLPAGVPAAVGCKGRVAVSFKAGRKTVSTRRVSLEGDCTYSSAVKFKLPKRLKPKRLSVVTVFAGNAVVEPLTAPRSRVRTR